MPENTETFFIFSDNMTSPVKQAGFALDCFIIDWFGMHEDIMYTRILF